MNIEIFFDLFPVILAVIAINLLAKKYSKYRRSMDKFIAFVATIAASVMMVAQLSWWSVTVLQYKTFDLPFANVLWTIFNTLTMVAFILFALQRTENEPDNP